MPLDRFIIAQQNKDTYKYALQNFKDGAKQGHYIWYILPRVVDMSVPKLSYDSKYYAIKDKQEALEYLKDPILGPRYMETVAVIKQKLSEGVNANDLMGEKFFGPTLAEIDRKKLVSSLVLFSHVAEQLYNETQDRRFKELHNNCKGALNIIGKQNYNNTCDFTNKFLSSRNKENPQKPDPLRSTKRLYRLRNVIGLTLATVVLFTALVLAAIYISPFVLVGVFVAGMIGGFVLQMLQIKAAAKKANKAWEDDSAKKDTYSQSYESMHGNNLDRKNEDAKPGENASPGNTQLNYRSNKSAEYKAEKPNLPKGPR
ncbi:MAG: hypothetical protein A3F18_01260 [Legionellales bacterium RIFCSPHIGHO2_12_FULL_37_14]|nr:MAG: hypothetical protein A3F18_01260 [Legionellales bacterium RIFCSPHIGHO2_12_FULL_37_14]